MRIQKIQKKQKGQNEEGGKRGQKGFSLIELIVSMGIIVMITTMFMANHRTANQRTDLVMTAQKMVADVHLAQNNSLGLVKYNDSVPGGGWGLSFDKSRGSYVMFADLNEPGKSGYMSYDTSSEGNISYGARVNNISSGIAISSIKIGTNTLVNSVNVTFLPPDPKTNIYNPVNGATSTVIEIQLQDKANTANVKTVRINFLGLAEVID